MKNVRPKPIYNRLLNDAQKNNPNATIDHRNLTFGQKVKALAMNDQGEYSKARIAGMGAAGAMGLSAAGRIISGGGLYKDADGNTDIIGIPFI